MSGNHWYRSPILDSVGSVWALPAVSPAVVTGLVALVAAQVSSLRYRCFPFRPVRLTQHTNRKQGLLGVIEDRVGGGRWLERLGS